MMSNGTVRRVGWVMTGTAVGTIIGGCGTSDKTTKLLQKPQPVFPPSVCAPLAARNLVDAAPNSRIKIGQSGAGNGTRSITYTYEYHRLSRGKSVSDTARINVPFTDLRFDTVTISIQDESPNLYLQPEGVATRIIGAADEKVICFVYGPEVQQVLVGRADSGDVTGRGGKPVDTTLRIFPENSLRQKFVTGAHLNYDNTFALNIVHGIGAAAVSQDGIATFMPYGQLNPVGVMIPDTLNESGYFKVGTCPDGRVEFTNKQDGVLVGGYMVRLEAAPKILDPSLGPGNDHRVKNEESGSVPGSRNIAVGQYNNVLLSPEEMGKAFLDDIFNGGDYSIVLAKDTSYAAQYGKSSTPHLIITEGGIGCLMVSDNDNMGSWQVVRKMAIPGRMAKANKDRSMVGFAARDTTNGANQWTLNLFNARSNTIVGVNYNGTEEVRGVRWLTTEEAKLPEKIKKYVESVLVLVGKDARILERILVLKAAPIEPTKDKMVK